jgi:hypothetical protein
MILLRELCPLYILYNNFFQQKAVLDARSEIQASVHVPTGNVGTAQPQDIYNDYCTHDHLLFSFAQYFDCHQIGSHAVPYNTFNRGGSGKSVLLYSVVLQP